MYAASHHVNQMNIAEIDMYSIAFIGFNDNEKRLADATIQLSKRRKQPALSRIAVQQAHTADVIFIDDANKTAHHANIETAPWLSDKVIIRVDGDPSSFAHSHLQRPIKWNNLPYIVTLALEKHEIQEQSNTGEMPQVNLNSTQPDITKILVVDDSETIRNHLQSLIKEKGLAADTAASVDDAVTLFEKNDYDCVLMDVLMPDIDGYEGCKRIKRMRSKNHDVPVIMLTSKSSPFDKIRGKLAGCDAYLTKPTTLSELFSTIENLTDSRAAIYH